MLGNTYEGQVCSIARSLEVIGERWTILIIRDAFLGIRRFDDFQKSLGVARNVLQQRLTRLIEHGILEKVRYQEKPERFEYRLTERGVDLWPTIVTLIAWGDKHAPDPAGPPVVLTHKGCGGTVNDRRICERCDALLNARDVIAKPGSPKGRARAAALQPALTR